MSRRGCWKKKLPLGTSSTLPLSPLVARSRLRLGAAGRFLVQAVCDEEEEDEEGSEGAPSIVH